MHKAFPPRYYWFCRKRPLINYNKRKIQKIHKNQKLDDTTTGKTIVKLVKIQSLKKIPLICQGRHEFLKFDILQENVCW
jgi:hypothetical protein